ncbi:hypothetical protein CSF_0984 [Campylobacter sputorum bv. faecalis CCUG 20703]|nr:hypothetical protein CSF_0984 [Campylobacter sputorum bv. faecalis CCUG 20703]
MSKFLNLIFLATLLLSSNLSLSGAIIDEDKGDNKGFNLATLSEVYNRQLHKDEEEFLNKHSKEFKSYYEKQTNKTISEDEAKSLLLLSGKHIVDAKDNGIFNILNFFGKTDFSKDELNTGINFIYQKSQGLKFTDYYKENFTPTDFFIATDEQFYNHNYNHNTPQGLSDESFMFILSAKVGVSEVKGVESTIFKGINISINNAYFNFKNGITKEIENIARTTAQKSYKGSTVAGHALDKHAGRKPEIWGTTSGGNNLRNKQAMKHFDDIMNGQGKFTTVTNDKGIQFLEKRLQDGRGIRLEMNGNFKGFID